MFQFTRFAAMCLCIQHTLVRESRDHRLFVNSPRLFADFHALHRLLMPRHPPYTLSSLTTNIQPSRAAASQRKHWPKVNRKSESTTDPVNDIRFIFKSQETDPKEPIAEGESHIWVKPQIQINDNRFILNLLTSQLFRLQQARPIASTAETN